MNEIREDMLKVKRMVSEVEMILGKREGETELVNKLIDAENLLTYCMSRLENAIVPPVKPGDTVYAYCEYFGVLQYLVGNFHIGYMGKEDCWHWEAAAYAAETDELLDEIDFDLEDIGKDVFLTREEAEKALAERQDKNEKP